ncbi:chemotaxis protein [Pseudalkalibacillus sp. SCS-8]|uniref:chemotaxis protein n=1 Tax=Pseudalkalibacillus nanhaiensis TaxID=3115291 RepID=UPI0032DBD858
MSKPIAVAVIHGAGIQREDFAEIMIDRLKRKISKLQGQSGQRDAFIFQPIYWGEIFHDKERKLWESVQEGGELDFLTIRKFIIEFLGDAIAYQPTNEHFENYERVHAIFRDTLERLSKKAGEKAPLVVLGHSLGTVISSNYFYDLQKETDPLPYIEQWKKDASPLMKGETLVQFISLGSPLALWSLRYVDFNKPIQVPSEAFKAMYEKGKGGWWNIYDRDDVLGYPLKSLNQSYDKAVMKDIEMNVGNWVSSWNPVSHFHYVKDEQVIAFIAKKLLELQASLSD